MTIVFTLHGDLELVHLDWLKGNKRNKKKTVIIYKLHEAEQRNVAHRHIAGQITQNNQGYTAYM